MGVSAQRGLIWFLMYDWYAALVEYRSGISSCSYRAIAAPKVAAPTALGCSALSRNKIACTTGDFLAADSVEYSSRVPTMTARRWRSPEHQVRSIETPIPPFLFSVLWFPNFHTDIACA
jgi:hypothetical protein